MAGTFTVPETTELRSRLSAIAWLITARMVVWLGAIFALGIVAADLARVVPGPQIVDALAVSVAVGAVTTAARFPFDVVIHRRMRTVYGPDVEPLHAGVVGMGVIATLGALVIWFALWATGTILVLPLSLAIVGFVFERPFARFVERGQPGLGDLALARRLTRFARELGLGEPKVVVSRTERTRSTALMHAGISIFGDVIDVPKDLVEARPEVLETRLAAAIVQLRRPSYQKLLIAALTRSLMTLIFALLLEGSLVRLSGAGDVTDAGFIPMALLILSLAEAASASPRGAFQRWRSRSEIAEVLDLTRSPDAMLAMVEDDANTINQATALRRFASTRPSAPTVRTEIARWQQRRRVTLLFTDVANSTEHLHALGDDRWYDVVSDHDHLVRSVIREFDGDEIDSAGDGFFVVFADGGLAVLAAIEMQRRLRELEVAPGMRLGVRMGAHIGEPIRRGREVVGREVNLASRISASAAPGEILVSQELRDELATSARFGFGAARTAAFKGFSDEHVVYPVAWWSDAR